MLELVEHTDRVEVLSPMRKRARFGLAILGLFPLLAPYELLLRIDWQSYLHPFFLLAAFVSTGAASLSAFLFFAAFAGLSSRMVFDGVRSTFTFSAQAPLVRRSKSLYPMSALERVDVATREWSDGAPTYHLRIVTSEGKVFETDSSWSREEVEMIKRGVDAFLRRTLDRWPPQPITGANAG